MTSRRHDALTINPKPTMPPTSEPSAPISSKAAACLALFDRCMTMAAIVDAQRQSSMEDQIARFSIWTFNMAVFATSKLSLDHRLRWTPQVRDLVTGLLGVLEHHIQQSISLLERLGDPQLSIPDQKQLLARGDFEQALLDIGNEITILNELSNTIRQASRKTQDDKALSEFTIRDADGNDLEEALRKAWADNILDRFPGCSDTLRSRLALTMVLRRRRILYRRKRHASDPFRTLQTSNKPLVRPLPPHADGESKSPKVFVSMDLKSKQESPSLIASTTIRSATTLALPDFQKAQAPSVVSRSRTIALDSHERLVFPRAPGKLLKPKTNSQFDTSLGLVEEDLANSEEICPFCLFILSSQDIRSEKKWREHVVGDLGAYICLFEECDEPDRMWTHSESWLKHMRQHASQWRCPAKSHRDQYFKTHQEFQSHLENGHKKKYSDAELTLVISRSRQPTGPLFASCPLCGHESKNLNGNLEKHIAGHLRSLALKSLPPNYSEYESDEYEDDEIKDGSSDGTISNHSTILDFNSIVSLTLSGDKGPNNLEEISPQDGMEGIRLVTYVLPHPSKGKQQVIDSAADTLYGMDSIKVSYYFTGTNDNGNQDEGGWQPFVDEADEKNKATKDSHFIINLHGREKDDSHTSSSSATEEHKGEIVRCICNSKDFPGFSLEARAALSVNDDFISENLPDLFVRCDDCEVLQHGACVGILDGGSSANEYHCERCLPRRHQIHVAANGQIWSKYHRRGVPNTRSTTSLSAHPQDSGHPSSAEMATTQVEPVWQGHLKTPRGSFRVATRELYSRTGRVSWSNEIDPELEMEDMSSVEDLDGLCEFLDLRFTVVVVTQIYHFYKEDRHIRRFHQLITELADVRMYGAFRFETWSQRRRLYLVPVLPGKSEIPEFIKKTKIDHIVKSGSEPMLLVIFIKPP